jgi:hypothetical protein
MAWPLTRMRQIQSPLNYLNCLNVLNSADYGVQAVQFVRHNN